MLSLLDYQVYKLTTWEDVNTAAEMQRRQGVVNTLAFHHWVVGSVSGLDWHEVELLFLSHYLYGAPGNLEKKQQQQELRAGVDPMNLL